ncbi:guanylate kinase [Candidatus Pelagibacter sp.]|nr:guanylate kinase [Candidatus Pelagibacter sp.]|tara:strand:- start:564 stop:1178 length:615 start_codon:yes stop_codon:yes gene_type:complete
MFSSKDGKMIILSSPSGAGKTTLAKKISQEKHFKISISHTTREPRSNEKNGVDYFFVSQKQFEKLIEEKAFLEYANVFKNLYGSTKEQVIKNLENGDNVLFDIDWQGAQQIKNQVLNFELVSFFILPPSKKILLQRLITRDENKDEIIQMRMKQFDKDVLHWIDYDFVVINEDLNKCYNEIIGYLDKTIKYDKEKIKKHIDKLI